MNINFKQHLKEQAINEGDRKQVNISDRAYAQIMFARRFFHHNNVMDTLDYFINSRYEEKTNLRKQYQQALDDGIKLPELPAAKGWNYALNH